jgi:TP901-1 family phage major tail protein
MGAKLPGKLFLLDIDLSGTGNWLEIAGCREHSLTRSYSPPEVTTKDSGEDKEYLGGAGYTDTQMTFSGLHTIGESHARLEAIFESKQRARFRTRYGDGWTRIGFAYLSSYERTGPYEDAQTFSGTVMFDGPQQRLPPGA